MMFWDPDGLEEYPSNTLREMLGPGDWLESDRIEENEYWVAANLFNLFRDDQNGSLEYKKMIQRVMFYKWFDQYITGLGHKVRWAYAAYAVAANAEELANNSILKMHNLYTNRQLRELMAVGNKMIFDDAFPELRAIATRDKVLTKSQALKWDNMMVSKEQHLIDPIWRMMDNSTFLKMESIAKREAPFIDVSSYLVSAVLAPPFKGDLRNIKDRWRYGMLLAAHIRPSPLDKFKKTLVHVEWEENSAMIQSSVFVKTLVYPEMAFPGLDYINKHSGKAGYNDKFWELFHTSLIHVRKKNKNENY